MCHDASTIRPRYVHDASTMRPRCVHDASTMRTRCVHDASTMRPRCVHDASTMHPRCIHDASTMHPRCVHAAHVSPRCGIRLLRCELHIVHYTTRPGYYMPTTPFLIFHLQVCYYLFDGICFSMLDVGDWETINVVTRSK